MILRVLKVFVLFLILFGCASKKDMADTEIQSEPDKEEELAYTNPVVKYSLPDPTLIKGEDGYFYLYATEDIRNVPIHKSLNLIDWEFVGTAFTDETRPSFEANGGIWAPDINFINGKYVMYYSMSVWGGEWTCGIGVATSDKPEGPFTDHGKLFRSNEIEVQNSIDPFYIDDNGRKYLFWGSFRGIFAVELEPDGLGLKLGAEKVQVAGTAYEGTYILSKGEYYYLFASIGSCCEGVNSTYTTVVARSKNLLGPYANKAGQEMINNHHEIIIQKNNRFVGCGHNSEIIVDCNDKSWILYHAVDKIHPEGRVLMLDQIVWDQEWPAVKGGTPGLSSGIKPSFE